MEDARNDGFLEDAQIFSLSEKAHTSVPGPSRLLTTHLHDLSDGDLETALEDCLLSQFSIDHTRDLIIARGDPANIADYNCYLQTKTFCTLGLRMPCRRMTSRPCMTRHMALPPLNLPLESYRSCRLSMHMISSLLALRGLTPL